ncbi:MAG: heme exporter protein CcmD [Gammaproteobacteria bacterium]
MNAFFDMGGYGFYVWSAYMVALIVLILNLLIPMFRNRRLLRRLSARSGRER